MPKTKRNIQARQEAKDPEVIRISKQYGEMYFDGPRDYGYGGYKYDGRWQPVARDIIEHFGLKPGDRVLDVGCAKGFLVKDLLDALPGLEVFGLDISEYALMHCPPEVVGRLHLGSADRLPFPDASFQCVHLARHRAQSAARARQAGVAGDPAAVQGRAFVRVDSYRTPEQKAVFESLGADGGVP